MRDFTEYSSFCVHLDIESSNIPDDFSLVEWITFVGCESGTTMAIINMAERIGGEPPPFRLIFESLMEHDDVIDFISREDGAIVTYKRASGGPQMLN